ncbi:Type II secretion system protein F [Gimesia maris]|nr:Type II secretion system protein F [Gimesia maris]
MIAKSASKQQLNTWPHTGQEVKNPIPMLKSDKPRMPKISIASLVDLNDELIAMIRAGIPLDQGLRNAAAHLNRDSKQFIEQLALKIEEGSSLEEAIQLGADKLPPSYISLLKSAIRMGKLPEALSAYTSFARSRMELRQEIGMSLLYPGIVLVMAFFLSLIACFIIFPKLLVIHQMFDLQNTPLMELVSKFFSFYQSWFLIVPLLLLILIISWKASRFTFLGTREQNTSLSRSVFSIIAYGWIPGYQKLILEMNYSTFTKMVSILLSYHVPLHESLVLAAESTGNSKLITESKLLSAKLKHGSSLPDVVRNSDFYPSFIKKMLIKNVHQNHLVRIFSEMSRVYKTRVSNRIDWAKRIIPVSLLVLIAGGITACYAIIVFLPFIELLKMLGSPSL